MGYKVKVNGSIGFDKFKTKLTAGNHLIISDEPQDFGGDNTGFNPFELLASSLAACTLATLKTYINMKKWDIPEMNVVVELESFPKEKKAVFNRVIDFGSAKLDDAQKDRLFQIAEKCPVHNILLNTVDINTELK